MKTLRCNMVLENPDTQIYYVVKKPCWINTDFIKTIHELNLAMNHTYEYISSSGKQEEYTSDFKVFEAILTDGDKIEFITNQNFEDI